MKLALLSIAVVSQIGSQLGSPLQIPVGDRVPVIDVQRSCKVTTATNQAMDLDLPQSVANCLRDEGAARIQLIGIWSTYSTSIRDRCEKEATITRGSASYVDLLTCMQMTDPSNLSPATGLRGASKNQDKN
jgi:hypothetical protein